MICVALAELNFAEIMAILKTEEMVEIRIDLLNLTETQIIAIFRSHPNLVATCRKGRYSDEERQALLALAIRNGAAYVDLECDSPEDWRRSLTQLAREHHTRLIISYHNFELTPGLAELHLLLRNCEALPSDIVKIVTYCQTESDAERLLSLYSLNTKPLIAFGMGEAGRKSRLKALRLGAPFIYAAAETGQPTAPGQMTKNEILELLAEESANV